jgi:hypothetical protein
MSWRWRRRLALVVLLVGLPLYVVVAVSIVGLFDRPPVAVELLIYVALGIAWALPLRVVFLSVARPDPEAANGRPEAQGREGRPAGPRSSGE